MRKVRLGLALAAALFAAGAAQARPPVWVVRDQDSELVLFGSVHLLPAGLDWRPPELTRALGQADDIWFELPIDPATDAETTRLAAEAGLLPPGQSLTRMLKKKDVDRLARVCKAYGISPEALDRFRPWLAEVALGGAAYRKAGALGDDGVEKALAAQVPATARRQAFETAKAQVDILSGGPLSEQLASLSETLREMEEEPDQFAELVRDWMTGDLAALDREALQPLRKASPALFRRLVTDRNARWTVALDQRLKGQGRTVVVVGMGHLIGKDGLPARLRALGYRVEGP